MTLSLSIAPFEAMPGTPARARVQVGNDGASPVQVSLVLAGIDPGWVKLPATAVPVGPGETVQAEVELLVPAGHPPCQLTGAVTARTDTGEVAQADLTVTILDGSVLSAALDPTDVRGGAKGRAVLVLRNRGSSPVRVDLDATAPEPEVRVRFKDRTRVVQAGQEMRVPTRVSAPRPFFGALRHRPFVVSVRTRGTPVQLEGAFLQRAVLAPWMTKVLAIVAVVALWATVAVVGITSLSKHVNKTAQQTALNNAPPVTAPAGPSAGNPSSAANPAAPAGGGGSGSGSGGSGAGGSGSGGGGSGSGSGGGSGPATTAAGASAPSRVSGKVAASQPGGVAVTLQPSSGGAATSGQTSTVSSGPSSNIVLAAAVSGPLTKLYGADLPASTRSLPASTLRPASSSSSQPQVTSYSTTTSPDGFWAFASVPPGTYTASFSKPGYSTANYVVAITGGGQAVSLTSQLVPGNGSASGTVQDSHGPLGGVQLTITDGTVTLTTHTPTSGKVGTWAVNGLSTPATYLVTATDPGYSNQTTIFTLAAGGSANGLKLTMVPGEGSLSGTVDSAGNGQPVGGLTVTASNGSVTRTTTTTTAGTVGTYNLPDLPVPGTYALTISGTGFVTQTQQAVLGADPSTDNATVNGQVTPSGSDVTGVATDANGQGLPAAGAILSNQTNVFKTLTTSSGTVGSFDFGQVPPGSYVLTVEDFGYTTQSAQVTLGAGQVQTVNLSLPVSTTDTNLATATIQGTVLSLATGKPIVGAAISLDGQSGSITTGADGSYSISAVGPGTHKVTASCPSANSCQSVDLVSNQLVATDYDTTSTQVSVALGAVTFAPQILMPKLDQLAGIVIDGNGARVPNPTVTLKNNSSGVSYTANSNPIGSGATAPQGGFEFDNLPSGTYTMTVTGPPPPTGATAACPGVEQYQTLVTTLDLQQGTNYLLNGSPGTPNASPVLTVLPQYRVTTDVDFGGSTPTPTSGVSVEVISATPGVTFDQVCQEQTTEPVVELPVADIGDLFTASFKYASGGKTYQAPTSTPFTANYDYASVDTALLVAPTPDVTVTLSFPWRLPTGAVSCNVTTAAVSSCPTVQASDLPTVKLTGTFVQPGGTTATSSVTATANAASGTWSFPSTSLVGLLSGAVTFTVSGGAFQTLTATANTTDPGYSLQAFTLAPRLSTVAGTLSEPAGSPLSPAIQVAPADPNLVVSAATTGNVVWQQVGQTLGEAFPGVYDVTFSEAGYDSTVIENFEVPLCDSSCTATLGQPTTGTPIVSPNTVSYATDGSGAITLAAHVALTVTPSFTPIVGLAYPTVTVTNTSGTVVGSQQLSASNGTATFNGLSATGNNYTVTVSAPSFVTSTTTVTIPFQPSTSYVATDNPLLTALGYLTGVVQGLINTSPVPIAGATVTATLTNPGSCSGTAPASASGQTLSDGSFDLTSTTPGYAGLCVGASYSLAVSAPPGYTAPVTPYTGSVAAGDTVVNGGSPIQLQAQQISQTFNVTDGTNPLSGVTVTGTSVIGRPVTGSTGDGTTGTLGAATLSPDPTTYTYTFQLAGYASYSETVSYIVGETTKGALETAPALPVALSVDHNTISGVVTTPGSCGSSASSCPLGGVTVSLFYPPGSANCSGSTAPCPVLDSTGADATATSSSTATATSSIGSYSFGSPSVNIPDGSYLVQASLANWQEASTYQEGLVTSPSLLTVKNVSIVPSPVSLSVTVGSNLSSVSFSGATVSLVPAVPPSGLALPCAVGGTPTLTATGEGSSQIASAALSAGSYVAYFPSVTPDYYTLSLQSRGLPAQGNDAVVVCPGGDVAEFAPAPSSSSASPTSFSTANAATFTALAGQITGTVALSDNSSIQASSLSVYITPHSGSTGTTDTVPVTCLNPCTEGTYTSDLLALGATYDVYAEPNANIAGYADSAPGTVTLSALSPPSAPVTAYAPSATSTPTGPFPANSPLTVAPTPVEAQVTVGDANNSNAALSGLHVTLTDTNISGDTSLQTLYGTGGLDSSIGHGASYTYGPYTQSTGATGVATFAQVVPDPNGTYAVTVCSGTCTSLNPGTQLNLDSAGSSVSSLPITVAINQNSNNNPVEAYYSGSMTGTVYDTNTGLATDAVYICSSTVYANNSSTCDASDATQSATESNGALAVASGAVSGTYSFSALAPGTWYVASNLPVQGSTSTTATSVDVSPGAAVNSVSSPSSPTFVALTGVMVTVNGNGGDHVTVYLCTSNTVASPCSSTTATASSSLTLSGSSGAAGSRSHTFSTLTVSPPTGADYYVTTSITGASPSVQSVPVLPGVTPSSTTQSATFAEPAYTVTYGANGATGGTVPVDSNTYFHGQTVTVLGNSGSLTKTGYSFGGWNTASDGSGTSYSPADTFTMPAGNVTLYAQWTVSTYAVTYDSNGGNGSVPKDNNSPYDYGSTVTVLGPGSLSKTGYSFAGWNTASDGSGTSYSQGATFTMPANAVTLYAVWQPTYTVTYNANGGTGAPSDSHSPYSSGATVTVLGAGSMTRTGYAFVGWNTVADGSGTSYSAGGTFTMSTSNVTLYAIWQATYTVTYNANGGNNAPSDSNSPYVAGASVTVIGAGSMKNPSHTFAGWNTATDGSGTSYSAGSTFTMPANNVTLYAVWN